MNNAQKYLLYRTPKCARLNVASAEELNKTCLHFSLCLLTERRHYEKGEATLFLHRHKEYS